MRRSLEVGTGFFVEALLDIVDAEPCNGFNVDGKKSVAFVVVVESLRFVLVEGI